MLIDLTFDLENSHAVKNGMSKVYYLNDSDNWCLLSNPEHELWKDEKKPVCVFLTTRLEQGIYETGFNFGHDIREYTKYDSIIQ